jgi:predicted enzyme related to lactoylglutathione lyase
MTEPRLRHVMIFCKDVPKLARFYEAAFDLTLEPSSDPGFQVLTSRLGAGVALHALPKEIADIIEITDPPSFREETCLKICFEVGDLDAARRKLVDAGGQAKDPWQWQGSRFCECADSEGNVIQIFQDPP